VQTSFKVCSFLYAANKKLHTDKDGIAFGKVVKVGTVSNVTGTGTVSTAPFTTRPRRPEANPSRTWRAP
jgi:hypothetical protein